MKSLACWIYASQKQIVKDNSLICEKDNKVLKKVVRNIGYNRNKTFNFAMFYN